MSHRIMHQQNQKKKGNKDMYTKDYWDEEELESAEEDSQEQAWLEEEYDPGTKKKWV
jgi:hypothetical protein